MEACQTAEPGQTANLRTVPHGDNDAATYVFLTWKQRDGMADDQYRRQRPEFLKKMVLASLVDIPASMVIIGIASELGQEPASYDLLHFNVEEDANQDTIQADAKACWDLKKQMFRDPRRTVSDEWGIPPIG